jgi:predicted DNA-binding ribbon-helix-helix protein
MIRKTMRVGEIRTSIKLEQEFWDYLRQIAEERGVRLGTVVNEVARGRPDKANLASMLRTYCLVHARTRCETLQGELEQLALAGNSRDLARVLEACPLPSLVLDPERRIRQLNRAFVQWLNLDPKATLGLRLDNIMILRGNGMREMWVNLQQGRLQRAVFNATYVSPGKVRTSQAVAVALGGNGGPGGFIVMFETLAGRG